MTLLFPIPPVCNRIRAWADTKPTGAETVKTIVWITYLHDQAPLMPMGYIDGETIVAFKQTMEGWERTQPYPNNPLLQHVVDFIRPMGETGIEDGNN